MGERMVRSISVPQLSMSGEQPSSPSSGRLQSQGFYNGAGVGSSVGCYNGAAALGNLTYNNIPGYCGFIPGKHSENVLGTTHSRTNATALSVCNRRHDPAQEDDFARRSNAYGFSASRRGAEVPGYTGFIPAKHATNVFGITFAGSNAVAQQVRRDQAVQKPHRAPEPVAAAAPLCWTGYAAAYAAAEAQSR